MCNYLATFLVVYVLVSYYSFGRDERIKMRWYLNRTVFGWNFLFLASLVCGLYFERQAKKNPNGCKSTAYINKKLYSWYGLSITWPGS